MDPFGEPAVPRASRGRVAVALVVGLAVTATFLAATIAAVLRGGDGAAIRSSPAPGPGRLVVVDESGRLSMMDADGSSAAPIAAPGLAFQFPAWSPDGTRIAAIGSRPDGAGVYVIDPGGQSRSVSAIYDSPERPPFYLSWSPDGGHVAFLTTEPDGIALRAALADGSAPATIVRRGSPMYWDWVDGTHILVHAGGTADGAFIGDATLDEESTARSDVAAGFFRPPSVTHDGRQRATVRATGGGTSIDIEGPAPAASRQIPVTGSVAMTFDPLGGRLAFTASDTPTSEPPALPIGPLRIIDASTGDVRTVLDGAVAAFFWAPNGQTIAAIVLGAQAPGAAVADGPIVPIGARTIAENESGIAAHLVFVDVSDPAPGGSTSRNVRSERDIRLSDLFAFQLIPFFDQYAISHRVWSPDSRSIVLPVVHGDRPVQLVVFPAAGGDPRTVGAGMAAFWSP
jgi:TolB protein